MHDDEYRAAVADFIYVNGITRCPTACVLPTQGTVPAADRAALERYANARALTREKRATAPQQSLPGPAAAG